MEYPVRIQHEATKRHFIAPSPSHKTIAIPLSWYNWNIAEKDIKP